MAWLEDRAFAPPGDTGGRAQPLGEAVGLVGLELAAVPEQRADLAAHRRARGAAAA